MREHCDGSRLAPMPSIEDETGLCSTKVTPNYTIWHEPSRGICSVCHEAKKTLKDGTMPKHDRYVSWKEQQARKACASATPSV